MPTVATDALKESIRVLSFKRDAIEFRIVISGTIVPFRRGYPSQGADAIMKSHRVLERSQRGFSLIELMIVIAVIAILVGVGIPAWQAMTRSGNEAATTQSIDTIRKLQVQYAAKHQGNFAPTFDELIKILDFDPKFKGERPVVNGYIYSLKVQERTQSQPAFYSVNADPQVAEGITRTGDRHFYFDSTLSTIRQTEENRPAKADDPSI